MKEQSFKINNKQLKNIVLLKINDEIIVRIGFENLLPVINNEIYQIFFLLYVYKFPVRILLFLLQQEQYNKMKYPQSSQKYSQPPQHQPDIQQQAQQNQYNSNQSLSLGQYGLNSQQIDRAMHTLEKIKKIAKIKLTKCKKNNTKLNTLFGSMSEFFIRNKRKSQKVDKTQRFVKKNQISQSKVNKLQELRYSKIGKQLKANNESVEPIINSEQQQSQQSYQYKYRHGKMCYICRKRYDQVDDIYPLHCPLCAVAGKLKRYQKANLQGMTALVTGGRIKIGYQIVLKLLRDGATVYTTTRFSKDAYIRYQKQEDFNTWKNRLFILQCDFMSAIQVQCLLDTIKEKVKHLDILINNAAQTLTRPKQFFSIQMHNQQMQLPENQNIIQNLPKYIAQNNQFPSIECTSRSLKQLKFVEEELQQQQQQGQIAPLYHNRNKFIDLQNLDEFGQPTDLRPTNTWTQKIQNTSLIDCISTQTINSTIPFYIIGQLKHLMGGKHKSYIINVSSMQGVFYRKYKSSNHPHTNMAKAAMNMITRTCALSFSQSNIYMNSIDTGWVTNQNPYHVDQKMKQRYKFQVPLDCIQGAMRVIDPIYQAVNDKKYLFGKFLKDYQESLW